ncbi:MAG: protoporphyrinogen oxidase [candidate division Zixibacteria bacterium]|nr:protoporphyrinogen oxidase [candidate division Zixibacteria bacterium]
MPRYDLLIIGGGISGLSALHFTRTRAPHLSVHLLEADSRLGGTIGTDHINGYSFDWGPNGFLDRLPLTLQLCDELGLSTQLERANANVSNRFILRGGRLRPVPLSPPAFLKSDILSWPGKLRIFGEPFARKRPPGIDESIYDFGSRRIGREAADYLIQPMVSGVYGGVASRLSLKSCFPIMREMEDQYGSLVRAMFARARKAKKEGRKAGGPSSPAGWLTSFRGGLYALIERFREVYAGQITTGAEVVSVRKANGSFTVQTTDGQSYEAKQVVLALPSYRASSVVAGVSPDLASSLARIKYAPIAVVCMGFPETSVSRNLNGFGFLVPSKENRRILGSIWTSSIFADRAPSGKVQFRTMVGGDGDHESAKMTDSDIISKVQKDLHDITGITGAPDIVKLYRWTYGIPQYHIGHSEVMTAIESELAKINGLHLAGNAYYGIGLNECVKQADAVVTKLLKG